MAARKYRICAHRGLSGVMPENTLPAFAAAIALGADEIEFDVRLTSDLQMVVCHDSDVNRISERKGDVRSYDLATLLRSNAGSYRNWYVNFCTPEQVLERYAGHVRMNIHIIDFHPEFDVPAALRRLLYRYDATDSAYFSARDDQLALCLRSAPDIERCSLLPRNATGPDIVDYALQYKCRRVQLRKPYFTRALVERAHHYGMHCNACWADDRYEAKRMLDVGVDTILTNRADVLLAMRREGTI